MNFIEGCTAQTYSAYSMHSAVVEIFVKEAPRPAHDGPELVEGRVQPEHQRSIVEAEGTVEWVGGSMGAK